MRYVIATALLCLLAIPAQAARHPSFHQHCRIHYNEAGAVAFQCWTRYTARRSTRGFRGHHSVAHAGRHSHVAARAGTARVCTKADRCAQVVAWAASSFQGLIRDLEAAGYAIGSPGCLSGGHMRHSKHHWGGACDLFNQVARNRTALRMPPASVQIELAERHGLTSGCVWRNRDCAHFEVPSRTRMARAG